MSNDRFNVFRRQGFNISFVCEFGIRHDGSGIGIDQYNLVTFGSQRLTSLRS